MPRDVVMNRPRIIAIWSVLPCSWLKKKKKIPHILCGVGYNKNYITILRARATRARINGSKYEIRLGRKTCACNGTWRDIMIKYAEDVNYIFYIWHVIAVHVYGLSKVSCDSKILRLNTRYCGTYERGVALRTNRFRILL